MSMNEYTYDVFLAYHGTHSPKGSYQKAKEICDYLTDNGLNVYLHQYSHEKEHSNTQWNHTFERVEESRCFLLVFNKDVPVDNNGKLGSDSGKVSQIREEVDAFEALISNGERNKMDFNCFYADVDKTQENFVKFFQSLHSKLLYGHNKILRVNDDSSNVHSWLIGQGCKPNIEVAKLKKINRLFEDMGWSGLLFSPQELRKYEQSFKGLKRVSLIGSRTTDDVVGGELFKSVQTNLRNGISYRYVFFKMAGAKKQLESIYNAHSSDNRSNLKLIYIEDAWVYGDLSLIKIYEFENHRNEGVIRVLTNVSRGREQCIYLKIADNKADIVVENIDKIIEDGKAKEYRSQGSEKAEWIKCDDWS